MLEPIVPDSYWVTDRLAAGEYPGASTEADARAKVARFERAGITLLVDLTHPTDRLEPYEPYLTLAGRAHHPIVDNDVPTEREMSATLDAIDEALADGQTIYVHWRRRGRVHQNESSRRLAIFGSTLNLFPTVVLQAFAGPRPERRRRAGRVRRPMPERHGQTGSGQHLRRNRELR